MAAVQRLIATHGVSHILSLSGSPTWSFLEFADVHGYTQWQVKTLFLQEVLARGLLTMGLHIMSYAHTDADVAFLTRVYDEVFPLLKDAVENDSMTKPLEPVFKLRS
jgi:glutamate-1-semialdehyde 2,1-aminomutase